MLCCSYVHASELTFYTYHDTPPYYFSSKTQAIAAAERSSRQDSEPTLRVGLYQALINLINEAQQQWRIKLQYMPRKRVNLLLQSNQLQGALIGVNPIWFKDKQQTRYLWSPPFLWDTDIVVVRKGLSVNYQHPNDLIGLNLAIPRGYYFWGVADNLKSGSQQAIKTSSELQNLKLLAAGRADATILSQLTLKYYENTVFQPNTFNAMTTPHDQYSRAILFPQKYSGAFAELENIVAEVVNSDAWQDLLRTKHQEHATPDAAL